MKKRQIAILLAFMLGLGALSFTPVSARAETAQEVSESAEILFDNGWKFQMTTAAGVEKRDFDDSAWEDVMLPHDYSITQDYTAEGEAESAYKLGGTGWYRKHVQIGTMKKNRRFVLHFDGAYMNTTVYVNGVKAGAHPYGYTMFDIDITDFINFGEDNVIAVCTNHQTPSSRWYSGSGIYRDVTLRVTNKTYIEEDSFSFTTPDLSDASVSAKRAVTGFKITNTEDVNRTVEVRTALYERDAATGAKGALVAGNGETQTVAAHSSFAIQETLRVNSPKLWSPENPNLYIVEAQILMDGVLAQSYEKEVGFRYTSFDSNNGFFLNGVSMKFKGVCLHHDQGALGAAAYEDAIVRQLTIMKEMGVNAVRVTHNPSSKVMRDAANRLGIMLVEEAFDTWLAPKNGNVHDYSEWFNKQIGNENSKYLLNARADELWSEYDVKQMVYAAKNDPSVIMWSLGNELMQDNAANHSLYPSIMERLAGYVDEADGTRPVTSGDNQLKNSNKESNGYKLAVQISEKQTYKSGLQGVIGLNYASIQGGNGDVYSRVHEDYPDWILYGSETASAVSSRGVYREGNYVNQIPAKDAHRWNVGWNSSAAQAWYDVVTRDYVAGEFVWTGFDYLGEPTPWNQTWPGFKTNDGLSPKNSFFGIVDTAGIPKDSYYLYQSLWNDDVNTLHIMSAWRDDLITLNNGNADIVVYSDAPTVELVYEDNAGNITSFGAKTMTQQYSPNGYPYLEYQGEGASTTYYENLYRTWTVPYAAGAIRAIAYDENGNVINDTKGVSEVKTNNYPSQVVANAEKNIVDSDTHSLNYIDIEMRDVNGIFCPGAVNQVVNVTVEGPAELVGLDNGSATDYTSYQASSRRVFNGKLTAIVRMTGEAGEVTVRAASDNLRTGVATFTVVPAAEADVTESWLAGNEDIVTPDPEVTPANIAPLATSLTQTVETGLQSDTLSAVNDGVQVSVPHYAGGANPQVWTNYNAAQKGVQDAGIGLTFDRLYEMKEVVLYHFTDSWSADLPKEVSFTVAVNGAVMQVPATLAEEEVLSSTTVKRRYVLAENATGNEISIRAAAKDGKRHANAAYCIGYSEIEVYGVEKEEAASNIDIVTDNYGTWKLLEACSDEFDGDTLDRSKWNPYLWYSTTIDFAFREDNAIVENGNLVLLAKKESYNGKNLTAGAVESRFEIPGNDSYVEVRAKAVDSSKNVLSAIWMQSSPLRTVLNPNPEIDIMETVRFNRMDSTLHRWYMPEGGKPGDERRNNTPNNDNKKLLNIDDLTKDYHVYKLYRTNGKLYFYFDDQLVWEKTPEDVAFSEMSRHMVLSIEGHTLTPNVSQLPGAFSIDYVRTYYKSNVTEGPAAEKTYRIVNRKSGLALSVPANTPNGNVQLIQSANTNTQSALWTLRQNDDLSYTIHNVSSGKAIDVSGARSLTANGTDILQYNYHGDPNQRWNIIPTENGYFKILSVTSGKALVVHNASLADGAPIIQWSFEHPEDTNDEWMFVEQ